MSSSADPPRQGGMIIAMVFSLFIVVMDNSILNVALPRLSSTTEGLGADVVQLQWIVNAYVLAFAASIFIWTTFSTRFGQRSTILICLSLFGVFSLLAAMATTPWALVAGRGLMGAAAAGIQPTSLSIISTMVPERTRPRAIGMWSAGAGLAVAVGPVMGGLLLDSFGWRSIFLVNVPIVILLVVGIMATVPATDPVRGQATSWLQSPLLMVGMVLLVYGITQFEDLSRLLPAVIASGMGIALVGVFFLAQQRTPVPLMPASMLFGTKSLGATMSITVGSILLMGNVFLMMIFFQLIQQRTALEAGYLLLPVAVAQLVLSPIASASVRRVSPPVLVAAGFFLIAVAFIGYSRFNPQTSTVMILVLFLLHGAGTALVIPVATTSFMSRTQQAAASFASGANTAVRQLSTALGVAFFGALSTLIYSRKLRSDPRFQSLGLPPEAADSITASLSFARSLDPTRAAQLTSISQSVFCQALSITFLAGTVLAAGSIVTTFLVPGLAPRHALTEPHERSSE